jgi:hypothetical protein
VVWSDTSLRFRLLPLLAVAAGDRIRLTIGIRRHRWTISIDDRTTDAQTSVSAAAEGPARLNEPMFFQENPTNSATGRRDSYPLTSHVRFSALAVNSRPLHQQRLVSARMSVKGHVLAPSSIDDNSFTVK